MAFGARRNRIRPKPLIFLLRKLRPREVKCFTSDGPSAGHCPGRCGLLLLRCGGAMQTSTWAPLGRGWSNSPVRITCPAGPESLWLSPTDMVGLYCGIWEVQGKQSRALWPPTMWVTRHLLAGLAGPAIFCRLECGSSFGSWSYLEKLDSLKVTKFELGDVPSLRKWQLSKKKKKYYWESIL